jgi:glycerol-3-phosphate acyltransferase PlsY
VLLSVAILTRYFSLGSISGMVAAALLMLAAVILWQQPPEYLVYTLAGTVLILLQHRGNIKRLLSGTERKLGKEAEFRE